MTRGRRSTSTPGPYTGPVPIVTHVHGAVGVGDESDGYAEAWYLPTAGNIPSRPRHRGHVVRLLRRQGGKAVRRDVGTRLRHLPVPEHRPGVHRLVSRPHPRHDPTQRVRRPGRLLHHPGRSRRRRRGARPAHRSPGVASRAGTPRERPVPAQQALPRDPHRHPGPVVQRGRVTLLPRHPGLLRRDHRPVPAGHRHLADLEPRVLRQHDDGQRQHLAVPDRRAAPLPLPSPQRLPGALPHPRLQRHTRGQGLGHRQRRRLPLRPGEPHRRPMPTGSS